MIAGGIKGLVEGVCSSKYDQFNAWYRFLSSQYDAAVESSSGNPTSTVRWGLDVVKLGKYQQDSYVGYSQTFRDRDEKWYTVQLLSRNGFRNLFTAEPQIKLFSDNGTLLASADRFTCNDGTPIISSLASAGPTRDEAIRLIAGAHAVLLAQSMWSARPTQ